MYLFWYFVTFTLERLLKFRNKDFEIILVSRYKHKKKYIVEFGNSIQKIKYSSNLDDA